MGLRAAGRARDHRMAWLMVYALAVVGPLALARSTRGPSGRPLVAELGSSLGIVALSVLAMQLVLPSRLRVFAALGADVAVRLHRRLAEVLLSLVAAHIVLVMLAEHDRLALLRFVDAPWRAQAAIGSVVALVVLLATSLARRRVRLTYSGWRVLHVALGVAALLLAAVHTWGVHRYLAAGPARVALAVLTVGAAGAVVYLRLARPQRLSTRPYVVERVKRERGGATTLHLRAAGHAGHRFEPGQFAWIKPAQAPLAFAEHPFSYSSSAEEPDRPSFTIKPYAGFSARAARLEPGSRMLVDGPHGAFRLDPHGRGVLLAAGGIGITPCISLLRTAYDRADRRRYLLLYGNRSLADATFRAELEWLSLFLRLSVIHVLSHPDAAWRGECGHIDSALLERHLPDDLRGWEFFVCGSPRVVDGVHRALVAVGIPAERVHVERFVAV